jgi:hypothetical protein
VHDAAEVDRDGRTAPQTVQHRRPGVEPEPAHAVQYNFSLFVPQFRSNNAEWRHGNGDKKLPTRAQTVATRGFFSGTEDWTVTCGTLCYAPLYSKQKRYLNYKLAAVYLPLTKQVLLVLQRESFRDVAMVCIYSQYVLLGLYSQDVAMTSLCFLKRCETFLKLLLPR